MSKSTELAELVQEISLADSAKRRDTIKNFASNPGALTNFAAELAATGCEARETVLVIENPSEFVTAAAKSNSIEVFNRIPTASDLIAIAAGDKLSSIEYVFARLLTGKDFVQLLGFSATDDAAWNNEVAALRDLYQRINASNLMDFIDEFSTDPIVTLAYQIATALVRRTPVIVDGTRALLAAAIVYEFSIAARSWIFVSDQPNSSSGQLLFKYRNWITVSGNQIATGDGMAAIASLSLARTAALLVRP
ncbi:MAG: NaMN:DMB phosphoribosyltransferase [Actinomycetota bacterium]